MDYDFTPFLERRNADWYASDEPLQRSLRARLGAGLDAEERGIRAVARLAAGPIREWVEEAARRENEPQLRHFDAHGRRVDDVVLCGATQRLHAEALGRLCMGTVRGNPLVHYAKLYLLAQNGEGGFHCAVACTDGMERVLRGHEGPLAAARKELIDWPPERPVSGAQFVTEAQGGSDVAANRVLARPDGEGWRLTGQKWFCSNIVAEWFLVTARPEGAPDGPKGIGLFLVPARNADGSRNGYRIERLKDKLGTRELPTAEVEFDGARGWAVGPLDRGLAVVVGTVLTTSRVHCVLASAAALARARREIEAYAEFREAFGRRILDFPLVANTVERLRDAHERGVALAFALVDLWSREDEASRQDFRVLLSLAKPVVTREATLLLHDAMLILAGNGIEERFTPLPRLWRDCMITETWEGAPFTLLAQAHEDMVRFRVGERFIRAWAGEGAEALARELPGLLSAPTPTPAFEDWATRFAQAAERRLVALATEGPSKIACTR